MHFLEWTYFFCDSNFTGGCSLGSIRQWARLGLGNGLKPNMRQAININPIHAKMRHRNSSELWYYSPIIVIHTPVNWSFIIDVFTTSTGVTEESLLVPWQISGTKAWASIYANCFLCDVIARPCPYFNGGLAKTTFEIRAWMSNYIQYYNVDIISYPCFTLNAGIVNLCLQKKTMLLNWDRVYPIHMHIVLLCFISWWRHQMEKFSALLAICAGNSPVTGESPHKGQWHGALVFSLICVWINGLVNNREAGDLRRYRTHYDVTVMLFVVMTSVLN